MGAPNEDARLEKASLCSLGRLQGSPGEHLHLGWEHETPEILSLGVEEKSHRSGSRLAASGFERPLQSSIERRGGGVARVVIDSSLTPAWAMTEACSGPPIGATSAIPSFCDLAVCRGPDRKLGPTTASS